MSNEALLAQRREMRQEIERLEKERDAALMELSQARAEREQEKKNTDAVYDQVYRALTKALTERNDANARAEAAEASAASAQNARDAAVRIGNRYQSQLATTGALLGRAVAALQEARGGIATIYHLIDSDREIKAMKACKPITDKIDAILADAIATHAADAWRDAIQLCRDITADDRMSEQPTRWGKRAEDVLAKVDARRAGGKDGGQ